jgi:glutathione synthase/RimK-type ligase-like ATP-grasp enzyme
VYDNEGSNIVCYGRPYAGVRPALNKNCGRGKIKNLVAMTAAHVPVVPWFCGTEAPCGTQFPLLARKNRGHGGEDIVPVFQPDEVPWRVAAGWSWFSTYIPVATEYRVWVFQGTILDAYKKVMKRPEDYRYVGRNFRNGFDFELEPCSPELVVQAAKSALSAVGYDFAAIDVILGQDGLPYVLEINTAPGVLRSKATSTLVKLADKIVEWDRNQ